MGLTTRVHAKRHPKMELPLQTCAWNQGSNMPNQPHADSPEPDGIFDLVAAWKAWAVLIAFETLGMNNIYIYYSLPATYLAPSRRRVMQVWFSWDGQAAFNDLYPWVVPKKCAQVFAIFLTPKPNFGAWAVLFLGLMPWALLALTTENWLEYHPPHFLKQL